MSNFNPAWRRPTPYGSWLMTIAAATAFILLLIDYLVPHGTIAHTDGALLVVISTALMFIAALLITLDAIPRWLVVLFEVLIILDIIGTAICAYFLETYVVLALMVLALIGWIALLSSNARPVGADGSWPASSKAR